MDKSTEQFILDIIDHGKDLTIATIRPDGYPQATTVSYANDGMTIYVGMGKDSQKANNIRHNNKVSLTINADYQDWNHIKGISMGATAEILDDLEQVKHAADCMVKRFPQLLQWTGYEARDEVAFLKIQPQVVSVLDYQKGFGHTELVTL
ncbi:MAG TPA: pyridoxamine 5'-phosphate oxidase family protein [Noviherbaspirillum sp.]|nr:pyridoxamine 5'-phosphate oxidase family protein [Noviherbaspirillum sp.]